MASIAPSGDAELEGAWEYEYDHNETEDFYFTLDLTTHVPDALIQSKPDSKEKSGQNAATNASSDRSHSQEQRASESPPDDGPATPVPTNKVQIIDLHTRNPLVKLDDGFYSCYWSTDLGTQVHVAKAGVIENPRRPGNVLDVIGFSQTRLLGKPISLQRRDSSHQEHPGSAPSQDVIEVEDSSGSASDSEAATGDSKRPAVDMLPAPGHPLVIPRDLCKDSSSEIHASFLERLSAVKVKKGEYDPVPIYSVKTYNGPSDSKQAAIRQQAREADAERAKRAKDAKDAATGSVPKKRRKRATYAEMGIDKANPQYGKRIPLKSGRVSFGDVRTGLGYQQGSEDPVQGSPSSLPVDT